MFLIIKRIKEKLRLLHSMRIQLLGIMILVGIVPSVLIGNIISQTYNNQAVDQRINEIRSYGNIITSLIVSSGYFNDPTLSEVNTEINQVAEVYQGRVMVVDKELRVIKDTYGLEEGKIVVSTEVVQCFSGKASSYVNELGEYIQITLPITDASVKSQVGVLIMSFSTKNLESLYSTVEHKNAALVIAFVVIIVAFSIFYSTIVTRPLKTVSKSIDHITEGHIDEEVHITGFTEIEKISDSFNQMVGMLQNLEDTRQEFVSNVSHELKTPLASMKVLADSLLSQEGMPEELYREFLVDINEEIERMTSIINDLLSMVKMDKTSGKMQITQESINELLENLMKRLRPIASERNIELVFESFRPVQADVDKVKLSMALNNLIENAIKYNYDDGWVRVSLNADHKFFYVKVSDSGVGIPEDEQENIYQRFYRVDKARSRETGGSGLGLALTRSSILMHRGSIKVFSKEKEGSTFTVRIPLNYVP